MELRTGIQTRLAYLTLLSQSFSHTTLHQTTPQIPPGDEAWIPHLLPRLSLPGVQMFGRWSLFCYIQTDLEKFLLLHSVSRCPIKKATDREVVMNVCSVKINGVNCLISNNSPDIFGCPPGTHCCAACQYWVWVGGRIVRQEPA